MAKRDSSVVVPGELAEALRRNPRLASAFHAMPASHRREYATWVGSAKKAETRESRAAKSLGTAPKHRLHSVRDEHPGIYKVGDGGVAIAGEVYEMTDAQHAHLIATEPPDLYDAPSSSRTASASAR